VSTKLGDFGKTAPKAAEAKIPDRVTLLLGAETRKRIQTLAESMAAQGIVTPRGEPINEHFLAVHLLRWAIGEIESGRQSVRVTETVSRVTIGEP